MEGFGIKFHASGHTGCTQLDCTVRCTRLTRLECGPARRPVLTRSGKLDPFTAKRSLRKSTTLPASSVHPNVKGDLETDRKVSFCACGALKPGAGAVFGGLRPKDVTVGDIGEATGELDGID